MKVPRDVAITAGNDSGLKVDITVAVPKADISTHVVTARTRNGDITVESTSQVYCPAGLLTRAGALCGGVRRGEAVPPR